MQYRAEIDGLRAVAVVPVILFHAGIAPFTGGYVGVDVFFVISGYLITSIIITEMAEGRFSLVRFYERRARRILPALFFVAVCCIPFAWFWMLPSQFEDFSRSLIAIVVFASNILFWREEGYFAPAAEEKPLLHTWSLAVEEQFYVIFPLMLLLLWRGGRGRAAFQVIVVPTALSFLLSEYASRHFPSANFYLLPTRAWELGAGSICAFVLRRGMPAVPRVAAEALALLGLALILWSVFAYSAATPFPSAYALAPVGGTALIILFGTQATWGGRLLSLAPLVGIGLLSYSAYLWHQPLFAFARLRLSEPNVGLMMVLAVASLPLAWLSWRFVEMPFRKRGPAPVIARGRVFAMAGAAAAGVAAFGVWGIVEDGAPQRFALAGKDALAIEARVKALPGISSECPRRFSDSPHCRTDDAPEVLLWGDSFAMQLVPALMASKPDIKLQQFTMPSCSPILGIAQIHEVAGATWAERCIAFNDDVLRWLETTPSVRTVILSTSVGILDDPVLAADGRQISMSERASAAAAGMEETVDRIRTFGRSVVVVSGAPATEGNAGSCLVRAALTSRAENDCDFSPGELDPGVKKEFAVLSAISDRVAVIWLQDLICESEVCDTMQEGNFIYRDRRHLSVEGSAYLGKKYDFAGMVAALAR